MVDLIIRLLIMAQASFQLAFTMTKAMQYCAEEAERLTDESKWAQILAISDLV